MSKHVWIMTGQDVRSSIVAANIRFLKPEQKQREQAELAGPFYTLLGQMTQQIHAGEGAQALEQVERQTGALENAYVRLWCADISDRVGYSLLKRANLSAALPYFERAKKHADTSAALLALPQWVYEADSLRMLTRKHLGDYCFDSARGSAEKNQWIEQGFFHYKAAAEVWDNDLSDQKHIFANAVVVNLRNLGALHHTQARMTTELIEKGDLLTNTRNALVHLITAQKHAEQGFQFFQLSQQLYEFIEEPMPDVERQLAHDLRQSAHDLEVISSLRAPFEVLKEL